MITKVYLIYPNTYPCQPVEGEGILWRMKRPWLRRGGYNVFHGHMLNSCGSTCYSDSGVKLIRAWGGEH